MKLLYMGPGASWSTADVSDGLRDGLTYHGVEIIDYALDTRIARSHSWLYYNWRQSKKRNPDIPKLSHHDVFLQAGRDAFWIAWWLRTFHGLDGVFIVSGMFLHPDVVHVMKASGLPVFILFTESPYDVEQELELAKVVDGCWTNERYSLELFQSVNKNSGYLPHAWHAERHRPGPLPDDTEYPAHDVVFVGSGFQERIDFFNAIDWTGIDLGLYGSWDAIGSRHPLRRYVRGKNISNLAAAALYRRAKIGLNLYRTSKGLARNAPKITHAESLNPRAYELAACGAFHLSAYRDEVKEIFGDWVPTFTTAAEAEALIHQWLADPNGRAARAAQLPACVAESSWRIRATTVIGDIQTLLQRWAA